MILLHADATALGRKVKIAVTFSLRDHIYTAEKIAAESTRYETAALVTLEIVNKLLPSGLWIRFIEGKFIKSRQLPFKVCVVIIELVQEDKAEYLLGSAVFSEATLDVPVKAVLNAVNRRLRRYL